MKEVCNESPGVAHLVFHLRQARRTARVAAVAEARSLLRGLNPSAPQGGALSEQGGVFWVDVPVDMLEASCARFPRLGYSTAVDLLEPLKAGSHSQRVTFGGEGAITVSTASMKKTRPPSARLHRIAESFFCPPQMVVLNWCEGTAEKVAH